MTAPRTERWHTEEELQFLETWTPDYAACIRRLQAPPPPPPPWTDVWRQRLSDTAAYLFAGALIFLMALFLSGYMPRDPNL